MTALDGTSEPRRARACTMVRIRGALRRAMTRYGNESTALLSSFARLPCAAPPIPGTLQSGLHALRVVGDAVV